MNLTPDRQGYLGDLMSKPLPQLQDILKRQETLLLDSKLLEKMPDKGMKTKKFVAFLKSVIQSKYGPNENVTDCRRESGTPLEFVKKETPSPVSSSLFVNNVKEHPCQNKMDVAIENTLTPMITSQADKDISDILIPELQDLTVDTEKRNTSSQQSGNMYERFTKSAEENIKNRPEKFMPSRSLKGPNQMTTDREKTKMKTAFEESAVNPPIYKYESTKIITIEESIQLIQEQKKKSEELAAERAASKLAEQFGCRMNAYRTDTTDMRYRETRETAESDLDSDDEATKEDDYLEGIDGVD